MLFPYIYIFDIYFILFLYIFISSGGAPSVENSQIKNPMGASPAGSTRGSAGAGGAGRSRDQRPDMSSILGTGSHNSGISEFPGFDAPSGFPEIRTDSLLVAATLAARAGIHRFMQAHENMPKAQRHSHTSPTTPIPKKSKAK